VFWLQARIVWVVLRQFVAGCGNPTLRREGEEALYGRGQPGGWFPFLRGQENRRFQWRL